MTTRKYKVEFVLNVTDRGNFYDSRFEDDVINRIVDAIQLVDSRGYASVEFGEGISIELIAPSEKLI